MLDADALAGRTSDVPSGPSVVGWAMLLAPVVGLALGCLAAAAALAVRAVGAGETLAAVATVATLAAATRGLHLDGLADTADGLGCGAGAGPERALLVMKASDIGPFGVVTLTLTLLAQTAAIARAFGAGHGVAAVLVGVGVGRLALAPACRPRFGPARPQGLGALVAGRTSTLAAGCAVAVGLAAAAAGGLAAGVGPWRPLVATALGLAAAEGLTRHCARRFGGLTGDVLGAVVETATTVALVVMATA